MNETETGPDNGTRRKRPTPQRQAPLRRPPLGLPSSIGATLNDALEATARQALNSSQAMSEAVGASAQGFVEQGVNSAYQVIEEYMRRGQEAAQRLSPPVPGLARSGLAADAANVWAQGLAGPLASSLASPWMQLVRAWVDGVSALAPIAGQIAGQMAGQVGDPNRTGIFNGSSGPSGVVPASGPSGAKQTGTGDAPGAAAAAPPSTAKVGSPRAKVTLEFISGQPAEFAVSLEPGADLAVLQAVWSAEAAAAAPAQVVLYSAPGHVHVRLTLEGSPQAGRHEAALIDGHGQPWGTLSMVIAERAASTPAR